MELTIDNVSKTYGNQVLALRSIQLSLRPGMFGLLGPNGAGKSTLMRTIATLQLPDEGLISFNGKDIFKHRNEYRKVLGFLPQSFGVYPGESAQSLLQYFAHLKGIHSAKDRSRVIDYVLELTNLQADRKRKVSTYSGGMRQRFGIAQLLLNNPQVIIVDEPTAGLDPAERTRFLNVLRRIGTDNIVIFSTHLVEDVMDLCHDMAIMQNGALRMHTNPDDAIQYLEHKIWETESSIDYLQDKGLPVIPLSTHYNKENLLIQRIYCEQDLTSIARRVSPKLEDFYFLTLNESHA